MNINEFPKDFMLDDYHEVGYLNDIFVRIGLNFEVEEIGFDDATGLYICRISIINDEEKN